MKFSRTYDVRSTEIGPDFLLKSSAVVRYFQECFSQYCSKQHVAGFDISHQGLTWVVAEMGVEILGAMPFWSESVEAEVWVSEVSKYRIYLDFKITHNGNLIARGDSCWYILNVENRRPHAVESVASHFEVYPECVFGEHAKTIFKVSGDLIAEQLHKVSFYDLDFNYHVNNLAYTALAFNPIPAEYVRLNQLAAYKVKYLRETFLDDELICRLYQNGNSFYHQIVRKDNGTEVCLLASEWKPRPADEIGRTAALPPPGIRK